MFMLVATFWYSDESGIQEQQYHVVQLGTYWRGAGLGSGLRSSWAVHGSMHGMVHGCMVG